MPVSYGRGAMDDAESDTSDEYSSDSYSSVLSGSDIRAPLFSPLTTDISSEEDIQDNYEGHCLTSETADGTPEEITQDNS